MTEYNVALTVVQVIDADTPEEAERIARRAAELAHGHLWYPSVLPDLPSPVVEVD
ncbi:hypothetical protein ACWEQ4_00890 [Rhodococcus sp. NPDC003994]